MQGSEGVTYYEVNLINPFMKNLKFTSVVILLDKFLYSLESKMDFINSLKHCASLQIVDDLKVNDNVDSNVEIEKFKDYKVEYHEIGRGEIVW